LAEAAEMTVETNLAVDSEEEMVSDLAAAATAVEEEVKVVVWEDSRAGGTVAAADYPERTHHTFSLPYV
jgi:hypothetical protein